MDEQRPWPEPTSGSWLQTALAVVRYSLPDGWEGTGEDLRFELAPRLVPPHSANVWGTVMMYAIRDGLLHRTGELRKMKSRSSHGRLTPVVRRVKPQVKKKGFLRGFVWAVRKALS